VARRRTNCGATKTRENTVWKTYQQDKLLIKFQ
jgi:hypothetical protein